MSIGGPVAVGKSTIAALWADLYTDAGTPAVTTGLDGFLFSNASLAATGIDKGVPESYDWNAIARWAADFLAGAEPSAPSYSHATYDIDPIVRQTTSGAEVVVLEGIYGCDQRIAEFGAATTVYLDADTGDLARWFVARFVRLVEAARERPALDAGFYGAFGAMTTTELEATARVVWESMNLPLVRSYIEPTQATADLVIHLDADQRPRRGASLSGLS